MVSIVRIKLRNTSKSSNVYQFVVQTSFFLFYLTKNPYFLAKTKIFGFDVNVTFSPKNSLGYL